MDADGIPELALLAFNLVDGTALIEVRETENGALLSQMAFETRLPTALTVITDFGAGGAPELAVLGIDPATGLPEVEIRDAGSGALATEIGLFPGLLPSRYAATPPLGATAAEELAVLVRSESASPEVLLFDAGDGSLLSQIAYSADLSPAGIVIDDGGLYGTPIGALVYGIHEPTGRSIVEMRDVLTGATLFDFSYPTQFVPLGATFMPHVPPISLPNIAYLGYRSSDSAGVVPILTAEGALLNLIVLP